MRVAIAGAGAVGRSIARELIDNGHQVLLIDKAPSAIRPERVPDAEWLLADSCELSSLEEARLDKCDVVIAATGDDKANLVTSLLAKTEFGVPRTVGRVNHPNNEWLFTEAWGVDVNVSTPRIMSALVEEAVTVGDLVRLFTFRQGNANLVEMTLPAESPYVGKPTGLMPFPENCALVTILRDGQVYTPAAEQPVEAGDVGRTVASRAGCCFAMSCCVSTPSEKNVCPSTWTIGRISFPRSTITMRIPMVGPHDQSDERSGSAALRRGHGLRALHLDAVRTSDGGVGAFPALFRKRL